VSGGSRRKTRRSPLRKKERNRRKEAHVEALIRSVLLASLELILGGGDEDLVAHSMSELDGGESW